MANRNNRNNSWLGRFIVLYNHPLNDGTILAFNLYCNNYTLPLLDGNIIANGGMYYAICKTRADAAKEQGKQLNFPCYLIP
jgi:hypothetical protein